MTNHTGGIYISRAAALLALALGGALVVVAILATALVAGGRRGNSSGEPAGPSAQEAGVSPAPRHLPTATGAATTAEAPTAMPTPTASPMPTMVPQRPTATSAPAEQPASQTTAAAQPPIATPTPAARYSSVEARPYFDEAATAASTANGVGVSTYQDALNSPSFASLARAAANAHFSLFSFVAALPYDDACRKVLHAFGGDGHLYWSGVANAVSKDPTGLQPMGPATWDQAVLVWQPRYAKAISELKPVCGY